MESLLVYNLGEFGINVVSDPIKVPDGVMQSTQNAQSSPNGADTVLRKRDGMAKINSVAAAGSIVAVINIPIS